MDKHLLLDLKMTLEKLKETRKSNVEMEVALMEIIIKRLEVLLRE